MKLNVPNKQEREKERKKVSVRDDERRGEERREEIVFEYHKVEREEMMVVNVIV